MLIVTDTNLNDIWSLPLRAISSSQVLVNNHLSRVYSVWERLGEDKGGSVSSNEYWGRSNNNGELSRRYTAASKSVRTQVNKQTRKQEKPCHMLPEHQGFSGC